MAAALQKPHLCAIGLGDISPLTGVSRAHLAWLRRARVVSAAALPEGSRGARAP